MSADSNLPNAIDAFSAAELNVLATTADALSAYLGQAVLAEVGVNEAGREWVVFGVPLDANANQAEGDEAAGFDGNALDDDEDEDDLGDIEDAAADAQDG